jgi:hypothetical protein
MAKLGKVIARVDQLRVQMDRARASTKIVTAQTISDMLTEVYRAGLDLKQVGAAATAAMGLAKLHGLLVDKTEDVTRRAARSPDAPLEIEVEHWLTEQGVSPESPDQRALEPSQGSQEQRPIGHGALLPEPQPQGSESPESPEGSDDQGSDTMRILQ